jgi:transposase InsO family protein
MTSRTRQTRSRKFKRTTDSDHAFNIAPNLLQQDFTASGPNQKWAGDIACVWTREGWVSLAVIIDPFLGVSLAGPSAIA